MHCFKRGISKDQKWTPFFPSLPSSPSHTHTAHILCVITIHWTRGGVHPGRPSHTGGVITPASDSWPCLKFSYYSPKASYSFLCTASVYIYEHRMLLSADVFEADLIFGAFIFLCLDSASCKFAFMQTVIFVYVVFLLHLISLKLMMGQPALQGEIILLGIIPS